MLASISRAALGALTPFLCFLPLALWAEPSSTPDQPGPSGWYCDAGLRKSEPLEEELTMQLGGSALTATATTSVVHVFDSGCGPVGYTEFDGDINGAGTSGASATSVATGSSVVQTLTGLDVAQFQGSGTTAIALAAEAIVTVDSSSESWSAAGSQELVGASLVVTMTPVSGAPTTQVFSFGTEPESSGGGWAWTADVQQTPGRLASVTLQLTAVGIYDASFETLTPTCHLATTTQTLDVYVVATL